MTRVRSTNLWTMAQTDRSDLGLAMTTLGDTRPAMLEKPEDTLRLAKDVYILERHPRPGDYPESACEYLLYKCNVAIITGHVESGLPGPPYRFGQTFLLSEDREKCHWAMEKVGIAHLENRCYHRLSGGERQLVLIARALVQHAPILMLDEPTANLDFGNQLRVLTWGTPDQVLTEKTMKDLYNVDVEILSLQNDKTRVCVPRETKKEEAP